MKKLLTFGFTSIFLSISLFGCGGEMNTSNTATNANRAATNTNTAVNANMTTNSNTAVVVNSNSVSSMTNPTDPQGFMTKAAYGGIAEVQLGQLAAQKAQNAEVKKFAQQMVQDHTNANTEMKALAAKKNVTLPTDLDAEHKAVLDKLRGLSGAEFDKAYMAAMVDDHEKTVDLFESQSKDGTDADAKALAAKTLPTLKMHLEMAEDLEDKVD